jgi:hypothetical protein
MGSIFMGMESSQQLLVIFLIFRRHNASIYHSIVNKTAGPCRNKPRRTQRSHEKTLHFI